MYNTNITAPDNFECPSTLPIAKLPTLLKNGIEQFADDQEQLLFLYSTLVALSGTMTKIKGTYGHKSTYPNLFFIGLAPAASGKSVMMYPKVFIELIHQHFLSQSKQLLLDHRLKSRLTKRRSSNIPTDVLPPFKVVFIPANCSSSKLLQHLSDNSPDTPAVMIESEVDSMTIIKSSDFGDYSEILRKIYENEPVSISRKTNNEYLEVQKPQMSLLLSGTPGQVFKLINNNEDGLFSRFLVMSFNTNQGWKNMTPTQTTWNLSDYFENQSPEYFKLWEFISKEDLQVSLSERQWFALNRYCDEKYTEIVTTHGLNATSIIKRHGSMFFKLCMVLTGIRKHEEQNVLKAMTCRDDDFEIVLYLIDQSLYSSLDVYESLPATKSPILNKKKNTFYGCLPQEFYRADAITKAKELNISIRSADRHLNGFVYSNLLTQPTNGRYLKCN